MHMHLSTHSFCKHTYTQEHILNTLEQMGDKRKEVRKKEKWEGRKRIQGTSQGQVIMMYYEMRNMN